MSSDNEYKRATAKVSARSEDFPVVGDVITCLHGEAKNYRYLLAHCEGGVVWGRVEGGALKLAPGAESVLLTTTLQEARLFGVDGELHIWRVGDAKFRGRRIREHAESAQYEEAFDERRILWGDHCEKQENGFALLADGMQGLRHWAPVELAAPSTCDVRLRVRSYISEVGAAQVTASRLVGVEVVGVKVVGG